MKPVLKIEDFRNTPAARLNQHLFGDKVAEAPKKRTKFGNEITLVDGIPFDSKKEAKRYRVLRKALKEGKISFLARQVEFELNAPGSHSLIYIADFTYTTADGKQVVEDCKGHLTAEYKKKKKLMLKVHGIEIVET
jgi:hypothetical protein